MLAGGSDEEDGLRNATHEWSRRGRQEANWFLLYPVWAPPPPLSRFPPPPNIHLIPSEPDVPWDQD